MRFLYVVKPTDLKKIKYVMEHSTLADKQTKKTKVISQAINFLFAVYYLIENGSKICVISKDGKKRFFGNPGKGK